MPVSISDVEKLGLRIGRIKTVHRIPGMKKIFKVEVELGNRTAEAVAGGAEYYEPEHLLGKLVVAVTNMESKIIAGQKSEIMLLAADLGGKPIWLSVGEDVPPGTRIH